MATKEIEEVVTLKRKRTVYICDACGKESCVSLHKCFICGAEVCGDCGVSIADCPRIWIRDADWCCNKCWKHGASRVRSLDVGENNFTTMVDLEIDGWKNDVARMRED